MKKELLDYFKGDDLAASTWKNKYAQSGDVTPDQMHLRMAKEFAAIELKFINEEKNKSKVDLSNYGKKRLALTEERIYNYFKDFGKIVPQGSVMSGVGSDSINSLSNCFVLGSPEDSYGGIYLKEQEQTQLMKRRGGVGIDLSKLRPAKTPTSNAAKTSTGAVSFMPRFSNATREVAQDGRRGALMLSLDIRHPNALDFIKSKEDTTKITGANISIKIGDDFMQQVQKGGDFYHTFPIESDISGFPMWSRESSMEYGKLEEHGFYGNEIGVDLRQVYIKRAKAKELWADVIKAAHQSAEPGILFWDNVLNYSPDGVYEKYKAVTTNPCGEIPMQAYDACRLIANNLYSFVINPFKANAHIDLDDVYEAFYEAQRLSDDLVELELSYIKRILNKIDSDPESDEIKHVERNLWIKVMEMASESRRTGLGFTALGDMIAALGLRYGSKQSLDLIKVVMHTKLRAELDCMNDLAQLRGAFVGWNPDLEFEEVDGVVKGKNAYYQFLVDKYPDLVPKMRKYGRRNVSNSTLAPTGTTSMMTMTTSGIEPLYAWGYKRRRKVNPDSAGAKVTFVDANGDSWEEFQVLHQKFKEWIEVRMGYSAEEISRLDTAELENLYNNSPYYMSTANDIDWLKRVEIQSIIQKYTSHSISSTINLPRDVSEEEVGRIYMAAWKQGLKGITVYRDGSRDGVLISNESKPQETTSFHENHAPTRPKYLNARLVRFNNNKEKWIAFIGFLDNKPYEIFTGSLEAIKIPTKVEHGQIVKIKNADGTKSYDFVHEEGSVKGINAAFNDDYWNYAKIISSTLRHGMPLHFAVDMVKGLSFPEDHINTWKNGVARALKKFVPDGQAEGLKCKDCGGSQVIFEEGCAKCLDCGSSKCG